MKRFLSLVMAIVLTMGIFTGCAKKEADGDSLGNGKGSVAEEQTKDSDNKDNNDKDSGKNDEKETTTESFSEEETTTADPNVIRENGKLPESTDDLTEKEINHYLGVIFNALKELDYDTLAEYTADEYDLEKFKVIAENEEDAAFWKAVIGDMVYFEDYDIFIYRSPKWIFGQWYMANAEANAEIPESTMEISNEEALEIYNMYYEDAPYIYTSLEMFVSYKVEDGYFKCWLNGFLSEVVAGASDYYDNGKLVYAPLFMGAEDYLGLGYDHIVEDFPEYKELLTLDLDVICDYVDANLPEKEKDSAKLYYRTYLNYFANEADRAIIQEYINEHCFGVRGLSTLHFYKPVNYEIDWKLYRVTDEDRAIMEKYDLHTESPMFFGFTLDWGDGFSFFYDLVDTMVEEGLLEDK